jgi:hypothetical protein
MGERRSEQMAAEVGAIHESPLHYHAGPRERYEAGEQIPLAEYLKVVYPQLKAEGSR